jgi:hypothetical protein
MTTAAALWALVIALGLQTGAGIFETRVLVPLWASNPSAFFGQANRPDSGRRFWIFLSPLTTLVSLANLVLSILSSGERRVWWLASSALSVAVMAATFAYFVPVLVRFSNAAIPEHETAAVARRWTTLNYVRAIAITVAWLAALKAFSYGA